MEMRGVAGGLSVILATLLPIDFWAPLAQWPGLPLPQWAGAWADDDDDDDDADDDDDDDAPRGKARERDGDAPRPAEAVRPRGAKPAAVRPAPEGFAAGELVAFGLSAQTIAALHQRGFSLKGSRNLDALGGVAVRLKIPRGMSVQRAASQLRALDPAARVDLNHFYRAQQSVCQGPHCPARTLIDWPPIPRACSGRVAIGLIDTGVDGNHRALRGQDVETLAVRAADRQPSSRTHGTAVASLLVGRPDSVAPGLLPQARLLAVDAFHRAGGGDRMDAFDLVAAIDLLLGRGVRIINLSFAGLPNSLVETGVQAALRRGVMLVAAAGNDGPRAPPRYPAAYPGVIAVTAVGADLRVYRRAVQGSHIDFAAPGVEVWTADGSGRGDARPSSGTSFAAPYVTAAVALMLSGSPGLRPSAIRGALAGSARDLGAAGFDPVFGYGLVQVGDLCGSGNGAQMPQAGLAAAARTES